jgi:hypothetical protein
MNRRELLKRSAALGLAAGIPSSGAGTLFASTDPIRGKSATTQTKPISNPLTPPAQHSIPVASPISKGAVIIDFCGRWEVFASVEIHGRKDPAFHLHTVAETKEPLLASGGMEIVPGFTLTNVSAQCAAWTAIPWLRVFTKARLIYSV